MSDFYQSPQRTLNNLQVHTWPHILCDRQKYVTSGICCSCSVTQLCPTLCDPMDGSTPGFPALHRLPEFAQTHVHWVSETMQPSYPWSPPLLLPSASGSFPKSQLFASGGPSTRASASASVLPMNIQGWFPLGLTGFISLQSKGLSRIFSSNTKYPSVLPNTFW